VNRRRLLGALKRRYREWAAADWQPATVLVYNLSPIYNAFVRWLRRQSARPRLVLVLLDSNQLGEPISSLRRWRYRFKPLVVPDIDMLGEFDACIGLSAEVETFLKPGTPFLWMPGACDPRRIPIVGVDAVTDAGPIRFGYFGALAAHAGIGELAKAFAHNSNSTLHVCGYGKLAGTLTDMARSNPRLRFQGLLPRPDDCLPFGRACDVLVNPRPLGFGNQNNFPSKIFDYALCGRAILSSRTSGVDRVLGPEAFYYDAAWHPASLAEAVVALGRLGRLELHRRGLEIQKRVCAEYTWTKQAARVAQFVQGLPLER
jgi:glycosyltransferase involved in cell wall biosynthesis